MKLHPRSDFIEAEAREERKLAAAVKAELERRGLGTAEALAEAFDLHPAICASLLSRSRWPLYTYAWLTVKLELDLNLEFSFTAG